MTPPRPPEPPPPHTAPPAAPGLAGALGRYAHLGFPVIASLTIHGALFGLLLAAAFAHRPAGGMGSAKAEIIIDIPPAPPAQEQAPAPGEGDTATRPAPDAPLPQLQGLTSPTIAAPPSLRSTAGDPVAPGDLLHTAPANAGATFAGLGARRAESVVYVVDASGAMVSSLKFILAELERSVRGLSSAQKFAVVLFRDRPDTGSRYEMFAPPGFDPRTVRLAPANAANKDALAHWLKTVRPAGRSNPLDGLRCGLSFQPDVVFLLSRSIKRSAGDADSTGVWGRGKDETLAELDHVNPRQLSGHRRVIVKAIQFLEEDPTGTMQAIGDEHGDGPGSYSVLTLKALGADAK